MNELLNVLTAGIAYVQTNWGAILAVAGGAGGLSVALEWILAKLHVDSKKVAFTLLNAFSALSALAVVLPSALPTSDVAPVFASLVIVAQTWHRFVISPFNTKYLTPFLEYQAGQKAVTSSSAVTTPVSGESDSLQLV